MASKFDPLAGLASEIVELPFTEGLANNFSNHFRADPKNALLVVENARLHEVGKFANREGFVSLANSRIGSTDPLALQSAQQKLFQRKGELGIIANSQIALGSGAGWGGDGDTLLTFTPNMPAGTPTGAWKAHGKIPRPTLNNIGNLTPDTNTRVSDIAVAGNFAIIAWHTVTRTAVVYGDIYFRVVDITNNVTVIDTTQCPTSGTIIPGRTNTQIPAIGVNAARGGAGTGYQAKLQCVAVGSRLYVFMLAAASDTSAATNTLCAFYVDMSAANPVPTTLLPMVAGVQTYSVCTDGTAIYVTRVLTASPLAVVVVKYDINLGILGASIVAALGGAEIGVYDLNSSAASGAHAVACTTYRTALGVGAYGAALYTIMCDTTNALTVTGSASAFVTPTNVFGDTVSNTGLFRPDIAVLSSTTALTCVTYEDNLNALCLIWGLVAISGGVMSNNTRFNAQGITNIARLFVQAGRVMLPVTKVNYWPASGYGIDAGFFLVELDAAASRGGSDTSRLPMLAANWSTDISAPVLDTNGVSEYQPLDYGPVMVRATTGLQFTIVSTKTNHDGTASGIVLPVPITIGVLLGGTFNTFILEISYDGGVTYVQKILGADGITSGTGFSWTAALDGPGTGFSIQTTNATGTVATIGQSWTASYLSTRQQALPNGAISGNKYYITTRSGGSLGDKPTPLFSNYILDGIVLDFVDPYRWTSRASKDLTIFGAASVFAYDGRRSFEAGVPVRPRIPFIGNDQTTSVIVASADGTVNSLVIRPGIEYFFRAVVTWLDANGDRWFSAPSYAERKGDAFSATPQPYVVDGVMLQYTGNVNNNAGVAIGGVGLVTLTSPVRATFDQTANTLAISYDNGASIAQTITSATSGGTVALTGLSGIAITYSSLPAGTGVMTFELPAQVMKVRVEIPACFSGMLSGIDDFKNAAEIWLYMTTRDSVSTYFLAQSAGVDLGGTHFAPALGQIPYVTFIVATEPPVSADQIYTAGGELENSAAPPSRTLEIYRDRALALSGYDNKLYYTKPRVAGRGLEWCQGAQYFELPDDGMGVASNETCFLVFTKRGVYAIEGYGPSATGLPANAFGTLQLITNQLGLYEVNSCKTTPVGVIFRTSQGWWLIDRALALSQIGDDISGMVALADQTLSIEVDAKFACVKIAMALGGIGNVAHKIYNYWYDSKRWSTDAFTDGFIYRDAMIASDVYFLLNGQDVLARSSPAYGVSWVDGQSDLRGHGPEIQTGWVTVANIAMLKRIWRVIAVVENLTPGLTTNAGVRLDVWADWDDTAPILTQIWSADAIGTGVQTLRAHLPVQKMKAIRMSLSSTPGNIGQNNNPGYNFIGLGFMIGVKNRTSTEPATRSA